MSLENIETLTDKDKKLMIKLLDLKEVSSYALTKHVNMSYASVYNCIKKLQSMGFVKRVAEMKSERGGRKITYALTKGGESAVKHIHTLTQKKLPQTVVRKSSRNETSLTRILGWEDLQVLFKNKKIDLVIAEFLLNNGFSVVKGKPSLNGVPISVSSIANHLNISRRQVQRVLSDIDKDIDLRFLFKHIRARASMDKIAQYCGSGVLEIESLHPDSFGVIAQITAILARRGVSLRSLYADHPEINPRPKLTITFHGAIPDGLIDEIRRIKNLTVTVYPSMPLRMHTHSQ